MNVLVGASKSLLGNSNDRFKKTNVKGTAQYIKTKFRKFYYKKIIISHVRTIKDCDYMSVALELIRLFVVVPVVLRTCTGSAL